MRHRVRGKSLSRTSSHRVALRRNMAQSLFQHGQVTTTMPKARQVQRFAERLITIARRDTLHARRQIIARLQDRIMVEGHEPTEDRSVTLNRYDRVIDGPRVIKKLFDEIAPRYADRDGGYTRIIRTGRKRIGDAADLVVLQLVDPDEPEKTKPTNISPRRRRARARYDLYEKLGKKSKSARRDEDAQVEEAEGQAAEEEAADEAADTEADAPADEQASDKDASGDDEEKKSE